MHSRNIILWAPFFIVIELTYSQYPATSDTFRCGVYYDCIPIIVTANPITENRRPITEYSTIRTAAPAPPSLHWHPIYDPDHPYGHGHRSTIPSITTSEITTIWNDVQPSVIRSNTQ